jgi:hypothetical protein
LALALKRSHATHGGESGPYAAAFFWPSSRERRQTQMFSSTCESPRQMVSFSLSACLKFIAFHGYRGHSEFKLQMKIPGFPAVPAFMGRSLQPAATGGYS